jgi:hypothetical protein
MIVSECAIVAALAMIAWHFIASQPLPHTSSASPASPAAQAQAAASSPEALATESTSPIRQLLPGLNVDTNFWKRRLGDLNRGENAFEQLEWRLVHSAMDAATRYVKSVVMPSLARAERAGR